jgi:hypothetical protein
MKREKKTKWLLDNIRYLPVVPTDQNIHDYLYTLYDNSYLH